MSSDLKLDQIDPSQKNLVPYYMMVENTILSLGLNPEECQEEAGRWVFRKGSAKIIVSVFHSQPNKEDYILVSSPVVKIPGTNLEKFFKRLLEINTIMFQASFSIDNGFAYLRILRECKGLDNKEIENMFQRVGYYADEYDDILKQEFPI